MTCLASKMADQASGSTELTTKKTENDCENSEPEESDEDDDVYEVERIVGISKKDGKTLYRVRWSGYGPSCDTWEPYDNLESCKDMIEEYLRNTRQIRSKANKVELSDVFSQDCSSDDSDKKAMEDKKKKNRKAGYYYVTQESEEADTLKDKFWRDLEQGKINVFSNDMYSKVKGQGRVSRGSSINSAQLESEDSETSQKKISEGRQRVRRSDSARRQSRKNSTESESSQSSAKSRKKSNSKGSGKKKKHSCSSAATATDSSVQRVPKLIIKTESGIKKDSADGSCVTIGTLVVKAEMDEPKTENPDTSESASVREEHVDSESASVREEHVDSESASVREEHMDSESASVREEHVDSESASMREEHVDSESTSVREERVDSESASVREEHVDSESASVREEHVDSTQVIASSPEEANPSNSADDTDDDSQNTVLEKEVDSNQNVSSDNRNKRKAENAEASVKRLRPSPSPEPEPEPEPCPATEELSVVSPSSLTLKTPPGNTSPLRTPPVKTSPYRDPSVAVVESDGPSLSHNTNELPPDIISDAESLASAIMSPQGFLADAEPPVLSLAANDLPVTEPSPLDIPITLSHSGLPSLGLYQDISPAESPACMASPNQSTNVPFTQQMSAPCSSTTLHQQMSHQCSAPRHQMAPASCQVPAQSLMSTCHHPLQSQNPMATSTTPSRMSVQLHTSGFHPSSTSCLPSPTSNFFDVLDSQHHNAKTGQSDILEFSLEDISPTGWDQKTSSTLYQKGPGLDITNAELKQAVRENDYKRVRLSLSGRHKNDLEQTDSSGMTLLMIAAQGGFDDLLELLVISGANINARQKSGCTALMKACEYGHRCTVDLLLAMGALINVPTANGETALMKAVKQGNPFIVRSLLEHGANFAACSSSDNTACKYAKLLNRGQIMDILNSHITRVSQDYESQVHITLNNTAHILGKLFPIHVFALSDGVTHQVPFNHELQSNVPGMGMLLFIAHARFSSSEIKSRLYGPCAVTSCYLNGVQLHPLTEEANYVLSFTPLHHGKNLLDIRTVKAAKSKAKLVVCAFKAQLAMHPD